MNADQKILTLAREVIRNHKGIIPAKEPSWIRRDFLPPGKRLGLPQEFYDESHPDGAVSERWYLSCTRKGTGDQDDPRDGTSQLRTGTDEELYITDVLRVAPKLILGAEYAKAHPDLPGMGWLFKVYDFAARIPNHYHQMQYFADLVKKNPKPECYHFADDVDMGNFPTTFFGFDEGKVISGEARDIMAQYLRDWEAGKIAFNVKDPILNHAYETDLRTLVNQGVFLPSGVLHGPGTALTHELQYNSDVFSMIQAWLCNGSPVDIELAYKDIHADIRDALQELSIVNQINWRKSGNANIAIDYKVEPTERRSGTGWTEEWIFYGEPRNTFTGTRVILDRNAEFEAMKDNGAYGLVVWDGEGDIGGNRVKGTAARLREDNDDEFLVTHTRATGEGVTVKNTGDRRMILYKVFGPGINDADAPIVPIYRNMPN